MPPVAPVGSLSRIVAFQASVVPVFCTFRVNCPNCPRLIVVGPPLVRVRLGGVGAATWTETLPEALCGGGLQVAAPALVALVPAVGGVPSGGREWRAIVPPGTSGP